MRKRSQLNKKKVAPVAIRGLFLPTNYSRFKLKTINLKTFFFVPFVASSFAVCAIRLQSATPKFIAKSLFLGALRFCKQNLIFFNLKRLRNTLSSLCALRSRTSMYAPRRNARAPCFACILQANVAAEFQFFHNARQYLAIHDGIAVNSRVCKTQFTIAGSNQFTSVWDPSATLRMAKESQILLPVRLLFFRKYATIVAWIENYRRF